MNTIAPAALPPASAEPRPMVASPMRDAVRNLSQSLSSDDLSGARKAYINVVKAAPDGAEWNPDGPFAALGRALVQGDLPAAQEAAKETASELRERFAARPPRPGPMPMPPTAVESKPSGQGAIAGGRLDVVA